VVCRSKHVEPSINFGIINSITRLHLVGYFYCLFYKIRDNGGGGGDIVFIYFVLSTVCKCD
jgi:hypothetical protein